MTDHVGIEVDLDPLEEIHQTDPIDHFADPFVIEGVLCGLVGAALAVGLLWAVKVGVVDNWIVENDEGLTRDTATTIGSLSPKRSSTCCLRASAGRSSGMKASGLGSRVIRNNKMPKTSARAPLRRSTYTGWEVTKRKYRRNKDLHAETRYFAFHRHPMC